MRRIVVDASVMAAIAFGEPDAPQWGYRLEGAQLFAPTLLQYELSSVARKKCRQHPEQLRRILLALDLALDPRRGITWMDPNPVDVVVLSNATGLSSYDASYLWLAGILEADLVTRDRELAAAHDALAGGRQGSTGDPP
jgi:predicted nucleic acid-binding protein